MLSKHKTFTTEEAMEPLAPDETWAVTAFADADLGDLRRTQRLVELATALASGRGPRSPRLSAAIAPC